MPLRLTGLARVLQDRLVSESQGWEGIFEIHLPAISDTNSAIASSSGVV